MQTVSLWMQMSLDGYASGPDDAFDWPVVEAELQQYFVDELRDLGGFLYGRRVYEGMAAFWPTADADPAFPPYFAQYAQIWRPMPKVVFSKTLTGAEWNTRVVGDDISGAVDELTREPGNGLVLFGGPDIASTFIRLGLIDEYRLFVHPVVLGGGTPLFPALSDRLGLELVESRTFDGAVTHLRYRARR